MCYLDAAVVVMACAGLGVAVIYGTYHFMKKFSTRKEDPKELEIENVEEKIEN